MRMLLRMLMMVLTMSVALCSCEKDDYRPPHHDDGGDQPDFSFTYDGSTANVYTRQTHTKGDNGFQVVILAEGYSVDEINDDLFYEDVNNAIDALFAQEPMKSMREYFDIYEVEVSSDHSGIDYEEHNTAFSCYLDDESTDVFGDNEKVQNFMWNALRKDQSRFKNSLAIVLLNTEYYAGVTQMAEDKTVTDSIPGGLSIAYVPAAPKTSHGVDVFKEVLQHEAVGHGIAKLADEYYYNKQWTTKDLDEFTSGQKVGFFQNINYTANPKKGTPNDDYAFIYDKKIHGKQRTFEPEYVAYDRLYPFAHDERYYADENLWIQGGNTFLLIDNDDVEAKCSSPFYRSSDYSMMNSVVDESGKHAFNALSRMMIYKRVNRVVWGAKWKYDHETFAQFDTNGRRIAKTIKAYTARQTPYAKEWTPETKPLARPKKIITICQ